MDRRYLLRAALAVPFAAPGFAAPILAATATAKAARRVRPTDPAWPAPAAWEGLRRRLVGRLIEPRPMFADCRTEPKEHACRDALSHLTNPYYIGDQPSGTQVSGWLDAWSPAASAYAVAAEVAWDVAAAVQFARDHNLRLVVKGGGHSYQGTSNAPDSLMIWTRAMNDIALHDAFVGQGRAIYYRKPVPAVTVGAGAMWMDVYNAVTTKAGRYVQGGGCTTVGVAGLVQSGGFGNFSKRFGTASAALLEADIVTADGQIRTVNAFQFPDLFWALKGGGGGSLGVVTRVTLRTFDLPERFGYASATIKASSDDAFRRLTERFVAFYAERLFNPHWGESITIQPGNRLKISMVCAGLAEAEATGAWRPFFDWVAASPADFTFTSKAEVGTVPARRWWDAEAQRRAGSKSVVFDDRPGAPADHAWWAGDQEQVGAFLYAYDSLWLPASLLDGEQRARLADGLFAASRQAAVMLHFNKGLAGAPPAAIEAARNTAVNPAVLTAFALAIIADGGPARYPALGLAPMDQAHARATARAIDAATAALRPLAPAGGSYLSESNYFNADWRGAYWGSNYPRLAAVKARYDPDGLFTVHHGVGSDQWSADGFTRLARA
ncbi:MAG: FAD-binding protein [Caulobacteraceae bacterium]